MDGKLILWQHPAAETNTEWIAREKRAEARFRASERRAWITCIVENLVMIAVAVCTVFSIGIAMIML